MEQVILIIHVIVALTVIGLILIQHGKGAEVGASFGSGASQTIFGSQGSGSFLTHLTAIMVVLFFLTTLGLGFLTAHRTKPQSIETLMEQVQKKQGNQAPASVPGNPGKASGTQTEVPEIPQVPPSKQ